jgi:hypothetical protein
MTFYQKLEPGGRRWRVQALTSRRSSARSFLAAISRRPARGRRSGSAPLATAPASCQDWQGVFVVTHLGRAGLIMQGDH